jgi:phosphatidylinositol glycan class B
MPKDHTSHTPAETTQLSRLQLTVLVILFRLANASLVWTQFDPDEFWQAHEVAHKLVFGYGHLTWEWTHAIRSHVHVLPFALTMAGLRLLRLAWAPRAVQAVAAALDDICLFDFTSAYFNSSFAGHFALCWSLCSWFVWFAQVRTYSRADPYPSPNPSPITLTPA